MKLETTASLLKHWRKMRNYSQLELALDCDTSSRHLSFIENNRANPSRKLLLALSSRLEMPLRVRNTLLNGAGYAPIYQETGLSEPEMQSVNTILTKIIRQHDPNPAMLVDRCLNIIRTNQAFDVLCKNFVDENTFFTDRTLNLIDLLFSSQGMAKNIANLPYVYQTMFARLKRILALDPQNIELLKLFQKIESCRPKSNDCNMATKSAEEVEQANMPQLIMPINFRKGAIEVNMLTTVTTLGSPMNITLQELQIECAYPFDEQSEQQLMTLYREAINS